MTSSKVLTIVFLALGMPLISCDIVRLAYARAETSDSIIQFTDLYRSYISVTNKEEANGLRKIVTADFAIHDDSSGKTLHGEEAIVYAAKIYDGARGNLSHAIRFDLAKVTDQYAVIYAEETISTLVDVKDSLTPEQRAKIANTTSKVTTMWRWRHTWRKTRQGWKLASLSRDERPKELARFTRSILVSLTEKADSKEQNP